MKNQSNNFNNKRKTDNKENKMNNKEIIKNNLKKKYIYKKSKRYK